MVGQLFYLSSPNKKWSICVGTVDGSLQTVVQEGNIDVHIARHRRVSLTTKKGNPSTSSSQLISVEQEPYSG